MAKNTISQDFENARQAVQKIRQCEESNSVYIDGALRRIEDLKMEGETYLAMLDIFAAWRESMTAENVKLGQFADRVEKVLGEQEAGERDRSTTVAGMPMGTLDQAASKS
ncbi:hypothetical protein [Streptomyces sp. NPDC056632]|uniref:hypothetical protein n=1 Tax=Streptomyces sp. NPDC056632 TaxID=3345884 RepID=UPI0036B6E5F5